MYMWLHTAHQNIRQIEKIVWKYIHIRLKKYRNIYNSVFPQALQYEFFFGRWAQAVEQVLFVLTLHSIFDVSLLPLWGHVLEQKLDAAILPFGIGHLILLQ
jgi:hypothetical protein